MTYGTASLAHFTCFGCSSLGRGISSIIAKEGYALPSKILAHQTLQNIKLGIVDELIVSDIKSIPVK